MNDLYQTTGNLLAGWSIGTPPTGWAAGDQLGSIVNGVWTPGRNGEGLVTLASALTLPANEWVQIAGTSLQRLKDVIEQYPVGHPLYWRFLLHDRSTGKDVNRLTRSWVGACWDGRRMYYPWGGGHGDSSVNSIPVFDVGVMDWEMECRPSRPDEPGFEWASAYNTNFTSYKDGTGNPDTDGLLWDRLPNGKPTSRHTYNGVWLDTRRQQIGTGRISQWLYDLGSKGTSRKRWQYNGGAPQVFTIRQEIHYHHGQDALYGYFARSDSDYYTWGKCLLPGANVTPLSTTGVGWMARGQSSVRLDEDRFLIFWLKNGVEAAGIYNMAEEQWEPGAGNLVTDGVVYTAAHEMLGCVYIPTWGARGRVIRMGTYGTALGGKFWMYDIAENRNLPYTPAGRFPTAVQSIPGNKARHLPEYGIAIWIDDRSTPSSNAFMYAMRYAA